MFSSQCCLLHSALLGGFCLFRVAMAFLQPQLMLFFMAIGDTAPPEQILLIWLIRTFEYVHFMEVWEKDAFNRGEKRDSALSADKAAALIRERRKPKFRCNSKASV